MRLHILNYNSVLKVRKGFFASLLLLSLTTLVIDYRTGSPAKLEVMWSGGDDTAAYCGWEGVTCVKTAVQEIALDNLSFEIPVSALVTLVKSIDVSPKHPLNFK